MSWIKNQNKDRDYYLFKGRAYLDVVPGKNTTRTVRASLSNPFEFYNDPAVRLSDADLEIFNGTEGIPLKIEHGKDKTFGNTDVGVVHHSYISDNNGRRALDIMGRIPKNDLGHDVFSRIRCGEFRGLSVGYNNRMTERFDGTNDLEFKNFREISICRKPFFRGCDISVVASKEKVTLISFYY